MMLINLMGGKNGMASLNERPLQISNGLISYYIGMRECVLNVVLSNFSVR